MANIFKQSLDVTQHPNRNNHDLSHKVHGSYKMGVLYPFLCHPVVPNDSFRIDTACAFQLMPMPFPTQTNIRCIFHYFYVRNKNIWENWENWLQGLEEHTPPYINQPATFYKTGSLADHLGIPTTIVRGDSIDFEDANPKLFFSNNQGELVSPYLFSNLSFNVAKNYRGNIAYQFYPIIDDEASYNGSYLTIFKDWFKPSTVSSYLEFEASFFSSLVGLTDDNTDVQFTNRVRNSVKLVLLSTDRPQSTSASSFELVDVIDSSLISGFNLTVSKGSTSVGGESVSIFKVSYSFEGDELTTLLNDAKALVGDKDFVTLGLLLVANSSEYQTNILESPMHQSYISYYLNSPVGIYDISDYPLLCPYYSSSNSGTDTQKISALPFRAYESIIRCYYKNSVLQPLKIDGVEKYNRYNTALGDGADSTDYVLEQRNWELDAYTSCLPSPQQGNTPLVGITDSGRGVIEDPETGERLRFTATRDSENGTESIEVEGGEGLENMRTLVNLSRTNTSGITIPDIRDVNALQRFLEQSIRSGYKYIDFIKGHFGSEPKYAELDMPEFLGGFTQRVDVNMISNSNGVVPTDADDIALGSFAGQARAFGGAKHGITRYFDDYGWLVGVMCIVPDNTYSQLLPKWFSYTDRLSYFFPEFAQTNLQPITYGEVCPIQSHLEYSSGQTGHLLTDTFGYQRPNHELVWCPDSLHGEFRKTLNNYVINRVFQSRPELGDQFLKIDPEDTNRIFSYTEADNDVVVGQIAIKMTAKRPVPRIVIPSLGK